MGYARTLEYYQNLYNVSRRTIQRWKKKGWPLDDEAATRDLVGKLQESDDQDGTPWTCGDGPLGLKSSIERLEQAERDAHASWLSALDAGDELTAGKRQRQWMELADSLRKIAKDSPQVEEANRQSVPISDLQKTLGELFSNLRVDLETLPRRLAKNCQGKDLHEIREIIQKETDSIIENLHSCSYLMERNDG